MGVYLYSRMGYISLITSYNALILTFDPNFQRDIQVGIFGGAARFCCVGLFAWLNGVFEWNVSKSDTYLER